MVGKTQGLRHQVRKMADEQNERDLNPFITLIFDIGLKQELTNCGLDP